MPTADRRAFVARAVEYFMRQDYGQRELIIVDDGRDAVGDLMPADARVRYFRLDKKLTVGAKRNFACEQARGLVVAHWDDDDWHAPRRLSYQIGAMLGAGADVCGISTLLFYDPRAGRAWRYAYPPRQKAWLSGSSLCYRREFWARNRFREINVGEDARFVWESRAARLHALPDPTFHVGIIHSANVSPKKTGGAYWKSHPADEVRRLLGDDLDFYEQLRDAPTPSERAVTPAPNNVKRPAAPAPASNDNGARAVVCGPQSDTHEALASVGDARDANGAQVTNGARAASAGGDVAAGVRGKGGRAALVTAAYGVGDILRVTPLVGALARLGYEVDVLVAPDYPETAQLLAGAPAIRRLFVHENFRSTRGLRPVPEVAGETYELATFTVWSAPLRRWVRAGRTLEFARGEWLRDGDAASVEKIARAAGWEGALPEPFAVHSARRFDLPPGTVALHPGCKPDWPWKKWHGFDELARMFPSVAVVGTESDLRNEATYFRKNFEWPAHARNFVGQLSLRDTAALLAECAALVSNDSGLMHLGVAVGTPTFGVFGITSQRREAIASPRMFALTKGLACEPECRRGAWGRRDCHRHLECLRTLTAAEVHARVIEQLPELANATAAARELVEVSTEVTTVNAVGATVNAASEPVKAASESVNVVGESVKAASELVSAASESVNAESETFDVGSESVGVDAVRPRVGGARGEAREVDEVDEMNELSLTYYGYVFDASGYGQAARAYIHALDRAGVRVSVVPLANRPAQVRDELVESLVGRRVTPDFHLFHGIPPQWAARAFPLRNAIGMTVWETDAMPAQWRNALNHVLEVWLPCEHNVSVFSRALEKPIFKLPHALLPAHVNGDRVADPSAFLGVSPEDFVFYSLFEWQQRKCPRELVETFMREFAGEAAAVLVVKTNPGAAGAAARAVEEVRAATGSCARVIVKAEGWTDGQIDALHARGDCYVSLHRGEGWGYPAFEAAARGTPVVATGYSGPLEYLSDEGHSLVRCRTVEVRQPYVYYSPRMKWAEPDLDHAAALMRGVFERREEARARAASAAENLRAAFSLEAVGRTARARLFELLRRTQPERWRRVAGAARANAPAPSAPIPADWYDADYFEHGVKSNWERGYRWELFCDLFRKTAGYLTEMFPEAESFLDAGCAKGFLVRALRERGKDCLGFDHSPWAVAGADDSVKPYVLRAGADDVGFEREFDILVAFSLFESLTEDQIRSFLVRARGWTRHALVATIPTLAEGARQEARSPGDRDSSHITMRTRAWWHETLLAAGWRQDALHRIVERACQSHELPRRMGWQVYVYAPR